MVGFRNRGCAHACCLPKEVPITELHNSILIILFALNLMFNPYLVIRVAVGTERTIGALVHSLVAGNTCTSMCDP